MVQVFDSWAAELSPTSFKQFSQPYLAYISANLPKRLAEMQLDPVPMIVFAKGAWHALDALCDLGYDVVGLDWLQDAAAAVKVRGDRAVVFQGNADPGVLYGTKDAITGAVTEMVDGFGGGKKGWIANLGHGKPLLYIPSLISTNGIVGITPKVNPDDLKFYFEEIRRLTAS
jgi:uroporphyrinogen decarboxylase